jgi:heme exporter protein D
MDSLVGFLTMGGYAAYVWPAFAIATAIMAALAWSSVRGLRTERRTLALLEQANPRRRPSADALP